VLYYNPHRFLGRQQKWQKKFSPYLVVKELPPVNYLIQKTKRSRPIIAHVDKLKLWDIDNPLLSWLTEEEPQLDADDTFDVDTEGIEELLPKLVEQQGSPRLVDIEQTRDDHDAPGDLVDGGWSGQTVGGALNHKSLMMEINRAVVMLMEERSNHHEQRSSRLKTPLSQAEWRSSSINRRMTIKHLLLEIHCLLCNWRIDRD